MVLDVLLRMAFQIDYFRFQIYSFLFKKNGYVKNVVKKVDFLSQMVPGTPSCDDEPGILLSLYPTIQMVIRCLQYEFVELRRRQLSAFYLITPVGCRYCT